MAGGWALCSLPARSVQQRATGCAAIARGKRHCCARRRRRRQPRGRPLAACALRLGPAPHLHGGGGLHLEASRGGAGRDLAAGGGPEAGRAGGKLVRSGGPAGDGGDRGEMLGRVISAGRLQLLRFGRAPAALRALTPLPRLRRLALTRIGGLAPLAALPVRWGRAQQGQGGGVDGGPPRLQLIGGGAPWAPAAPLPAPPGAWATHLAGRAAGWAALLLGQGLLRATAPAREVIAVGLARVSCGGRGDGGCGARSGQS